MSSLNYLWAAYSITMVVLFGYVYYLGSKQTKVIKEIETLKELYK
jgi:CcmD family protein